MIAWRHALLLEVFLAGLLAAVTITLTLFDLRDWDRTHRRHVVEYQLEQRLRLSALHAASTPHDASQRLPDVGRPWFDTEIVPVDAADEQPCRKFRLRVSASPGDAAVQTSVWRCP